MNRMIINAATFADSVPRTRGDEPQLAELNVMNIDRSPHPRG